MNVRVGIIAQGSRRRRLLVAMASKNTKIQYRSNTSNFFLNISRLAI
jgi:hypothetical protein